MRDGRTVHERLGRGPHSRGEPTRRSDTRHQQHPRQSRRRSRSPVHQRLGRSSSHSQRRSHTREPRPATMDCRVCGKVVQSLSAHVLQYHSEEATSGRDGATHSRGRQQHPVSRSSHSREAKVCHICQRLCPNLARHFQRRHQLKRLGFVCPFCRHGCSKHDVGLFSKHLESHSSEKLDTKSYLVAIPEGYYRPLICPYSPCHYRTLTAPEMDAHLAQHIKDETILAINTKLGVDDKLEL